MTNRPISQQNVPYPVKFGVRSTRKKIFGVQKAPGGAPKKRRPFFNFDTQFLSYCLYTGIHRSVGEGLPCNGAPVLETRGQT